jgi:hypothetical protein
VEFLLTFALSPFGAARRVIGMEVAATMLLFRAAEVWSRATRIEYPKPAFFFAMSLGFALFTLDAWDARAEDELPAQAHALIQNQPVKQVYYFGHWGYQYACERLGMRPLVYGETVLEPDDWLVIPEYPDPNGFYRPYHSGARPLWVPRNVDKFATLVWNDKLPASTVPAMYGGTVPITGRDAPRLTVGVYRVVQPWRVERYRSPVNHAQD